MRRFAALQDQHRDLDQRDKPGAHHHAVRHIELGDVDAGDWQRITADQQADAEHRQRPDITDKGDTKCRHRDFKIAANHANR